MSDPYKRERERDMAFHEEARALDTKLMHTKISVCGGGRKGPFTLTVHRLGCRQVRKLIAALLVAMDLPPVDLD